MASASWRFSISTPSTTWRKTANRKRRKPNVHGLRLELAGFQRICFRRASGKTYRMEKLDQRLRPRLRSAPQDDRPLARPVAHQSQRAHLHGTGRKHLGSNSFRLRQRDDAEALVLLRRPGNFLL